MNSPHQAALYPLRSRMAGRFVAAPPARMLSLLSHARWFFSYGWNCVVDFQINWSEQSTEPTQFRPPSSMFYGRNSVIGRKTYRTHGRASEIALFCPPNLAPPHLKTYFHRTLSDARCYIVNWTIHKFKICREIME